MTQPSVQQQLDAFKMTDAARRKIADQRYTTALRVILGCFAALAVLTVVLWWVGEHDSCIRNNSLRDAFNQRGVQVYAESGRRYPGFLLQSPHLACGQLIPGTSNEPVRGGSG